MKAELQPLFVLHLDVNPLSKLSVIILVNSRDYAALEDRIKV